MSLGVIKQIAAGWTISSLWVLCFRLKRDGRKWRQFYCWYFWVSGTCECTKRCCWPMSRCVGDRRPGFTLGCLVYGWDGLQHQFAHAVPCGTAVHARTLNYTRVLENCQASKAGLKSSAAGMPSLLVSVASDTSLVFWSWFTYFCHGLWSTAAGHCDAQRSDLSTLQPLVISLLQEKASSSGKSL